MPASVPASVPASAPGLAVVTGATAGIGAAFARRLAAEGHRLLLVARDQERLASAVAGLRAEVEVVAADLSTADGCGAVEDRLRDRDVALLVNNAGIGMNRTFVESTVDEQERLLRLNVHAVMRLTLAVLPGMVARGRGTVINIGSVAGAVPYPGGNVYGATKAFVHQFTQNLNADLVGTGVRATCVEPGLVGGTEFSNVRLGDDGKAAAVYAGTQPLTAEDIAETVHWVASRPPHVTVNVISMMPNCQSFGPLTIRRS